jgi:hypothetical protein
VLTRDAGHAGLLDKARVLAASQAPVLLQGETGAGKEAFARGLHGGRGGAFVALNCGGLSRELLASELFGYAEGAFTGARKGGMVGKIEAAEGGTLFLDELGELPLDMQPQLLRVLEQGTLYRLGETQPRQVRFRLVAATHRDLRQEVAAGRFRMDLYYRIASRAAAAAARAPAGHPSAGRGLSSALPGRAGAGGRDPVRRGAGRPGRPCLAGQCARAAQRDRGRGADAPGRPAAARRPGLRAGPDGRRSGARAGPGLGRQPGRGRRPRSAAPSRAVAAT